MMIRRVGTLFRVAIALGLAASPAMAQDDTPEAAASARRLSLADAVALGIRNNLDVQVERHLPLIAREELGVAWGVFDPAFNLSGGLADIEQPTANVFNADSDSTTDRVYDADAAIEGLIPWLGGSYLVGYTAEELKTDSRLSALSPQYSASLSLELEVPLLKNLMWSEPWTQVRRSRIGVAEGDESFRTRLMDVVKGIEDAYWRLIATKETLRVAETSVKTALALEEQTRVQYEVGVVSQVEVTEAEAGVAEREVSRIRAEAVYENAHDELVNQILGSRFSPVFDLRIEPTDSPDEIGITEIDIEEAASVAFELRPELALLHSVLERRELNLRFARNQRLPEFNVQGRIGFAGLSGRENLDRFVPPGGSAAGSLPSERPDFVDSHDDLFTASGAKQWAVRGVVSIPFGNVSERHSYKRARFELERAESRLLRERQVVIVEIRRAVRELKAALEGIEAAERRRLAAAEQLRAERLRLEYGESTPFDVLEREQDLVEAEEQKIVSQQIYHNSVSGLARAQGTTLRDRNISIEEVIPGPLDVVSP